MAEEKKAAAAPYGVFSTFKSSIEALSQGVPNQIDRTVFPGTAWNAQTQLLIAFRILGLVDEKDKPTAALHALAVPDEAKRKVQLEKLVRAHYTELFALDLMKTTPAELDQRMTEFYGVAGDTREKAVRFFLAVLAYLGIPTSPLLSKVKPSNGGVSAVKRVRRTSVRRSAAPGTDDENEPNAPAGTSKRVTLASGGTLTLSATLDLFALQPADRKFVFELIDKLEEYEKQHGSTE